MSGQSPHNSALIAGMPKPRYPNLRHERTRHGKMVWYVRVGDGPRIRMHAAPGTPEFDQEYFAAMHGIPVPMATGKSTSGSLRWLYERYHDSAAWAALSPATRKVREAIFRHVLDMSGAVPYVQLRRRDIEAAIDTRADRPGSASGFLKTMKGLFGWAYKGGFVKIDPTEGVRCEHTKTGTGYPVWSEAEIDQYHAHWSIGTKERVWMDVLLYTGLRRGDAVRLGRQHVRDSIATIRTEKSQEVVTVTIPILPVLTETLRAGPTADLAFICGANGKPLTKESFGNLFRVACRTAGINKSAHGLRKAGATRAAENGATVAELEAIFGWRGGGMASYYTRSADRKRLAKQAMKKLMRTPAEQISAAPTQKVRRSSKIIK
jgi:integrase